MLKNEKFGTWNAKGLGQFIHLGNLEAHKDSTSCISAKINYQENSVSE